MWPVQVSNETSKCSKSSINDLNPEFFWYLVKLNFDEYVVPSTVVIKLCKYANDDCVCLG